MHRSSKKITNQVGTISMTGYGKASMTALTGAKKSSVTIEVEIRSVNNRYLDSVIKLPKVYSEFESKIKSVISENLKRGRVDVVVTRKGASSNAVNFNDKTFDTFFEFYKRQAKKYKIKTENFTERAFFEILSNKLVFDVDDERINPAKEQELLLKVLRKALASIYLMRKDEGARLGNDLNKRLSTIVKISEQIGKQVVNDKNSYHEKLLTRIASLNEKITLDPQRVEQEVLIMLDRTDVTEELVRLKSHFKEMQQTLMSDSNGKKLDFLLQEIGREFNTVSNKCQNAEVSKAVVDAKCEIEKMREQVQNIE